MPSVFFASLMSASPWGGSEELWFKTAAYARAQGWRVGCAVYHWPEKEARLETLRQAGIEIHYLPNKGRAKRDLADRIMNKISKWRMRSAIRRLPFENYDITVVNMGAFEITMPMWRGLEKRLSNYLVLYHNYKENETFNGQHKNAISELANGACMNLVASQKIRDTLLANASIQLPRCDVLLNPISFNAPTTETSFPPAKDGYYTWIVLAALETSRKAQDLLIHCLSNQKWRGRNWTLHLYGTGRDEAMLRTLVREKHLESRIFFEGLTNNARDVLMQSHLLLQLTRQDAMPLSVVEALACARPVVVSPVGDMPLWIEDAYNGWISKGIGMEQIDEALERAWQQRERWEEIGRNGYETFKKKWQLPPEELLFTQIENCLA